MKKILFLSLALPFMSTNAMQDQAQDSTQAQTPNLAYNIIQAQNPNQTPNMHHKIWRNLIQILQYRQDLIDIIRPFLDNERNIPFLRSLSDKQLEVLYRNQIINKDIIKSVRNEKLLKTWDKKAEVIKNYNTEFQKKAIEIIKGDNLEELQKLTREKRINAISPITASFNEVDNMSIPLIHFAVIQNAIKCFTFLLINNIGNPTTTMQEEIPDPIYRRMHMKIPGPLDRSWQSQHRYEWDCMALAIYLGKVEIMTILEERGIEKGSHLSHIEAALLSYRNSFAKEILKNLKKQNSPTLATDLARWFPIVAKSNNVKGLKLSINEFGDDIDVDASSACGLRPIHIAASSNSTEIFEWLVAKGADIHVKDMDRNEPLHYAAINNCQEIGQILISKGTDINAKNNEGKTPLHFAAENNSKDIGEILISKGANINEKDKYGCTPLHYAATNNLKGIIEILISNGADINAKNRGGSTPLHFAAENNSKDIGEILISKGADINAKTDASGETPLHFAAPRNAKDISEILISNGADINAKDNEGHTPLHYAAAERNTKDIVEFLISHGADINAKDNEGHTPLHLAIRYASYNIGEILISNGADINAKSNNGFTPLHFAARNNSKNIGEILISKGADINAQANDGMTPRDYGHNWIN